MLILARRPNESLVIGDNITLTVLSIKGNQVRLGLVAPREVVIDRAEVHDRKLRELTASVHSVNAKALPHTAPPS
jgi:carbon storage regulator